MNVNFNYDLLTWVDYFIGAFACCLGIFFIGKILLNKNINTIKLYNYFLLVLLAIIMIFNTLVFDNIFKLFISFAIYFLIFKVIFKENIITSFLYSMICVICFMLAELTMLIITAITQLLFKFNLLGESIKTAFINIIIALFAILYAHLLKNKINEIIGKISKYSLFYVIILGMITIIVLASSLFKLAFNGWILDYSFILNVFTFIGFSIVTAVLLKQYLSNKEITDKYTLLEDYLKTSAELIEKYSSTVHKYKNNLIAIKGYMKSNMKEANEYIDNLLDEYNAKKYNWFSKINYIQFNSIRYLIYYKLSKAETENLKIAVDVSPKLKEYKNNLLSIKESNVILEIIGEYFDNAICASKESNEKEINLVLYEDNKKLILTLANSYKGSIELSVITKNGYTTKGDNHGLGLYDIEKASKKYNWIKTKYELISQYFVVTLTLDINKK